MQTRWYVETKGMDGTSKPQIVYGDDRPTTDKTHNGGPSMYTRVEPLTELFAEDVSLDALFKFFNASHT
jgi:hypothetical protein